MFSDKELYELLKTLKSQTNPVEDCSECEDASCCCSCICPDNADDDSQYDEYDECDDECSGCYGCDDEPVQPPKMNEVFAGVYSQMGLVWEDRIKRAMLIDGFYMQAQMAGLRLERKEFDTLDSFLEFINTAPVKIGCVGIPM